MGYERQADFGTPEVKSEEMVSLTIDGREVTVPAGTSVMRAAAEIGGAIPKLCATDNMAVVRLVPAVPGRDRRRQGHARQLHHPGRAGHERPHPDAAAREAAARGDGALHLRPPARLPDLLGQQRLRAAGPGRRGRPARRALRLRGREPPRPHHRRLEPLFRLRSFASASSARAACAPATRCRALSR